ncbi:MAG: DUF6364 family protein [Chloroflexota bacterium]
MDTQNITLSLPKEVLQKVKLLAVTRRTSVSRLVTEALIQLVQDDDTYAQARERQLRMMEEGFNLGTYGEIHISRDELHERR